MSRKSTKAEVEKRVADIGKLLIEGKSTKDIVLFASDKWGISDRQVTTYIKRATEKITKSVDRRFERDYSFAVQRYRDLYDKAYQNNDLRLCRMINKDLAELQELSKQRIEHSGNVQFISNIPT